MRFTPLFSFASLFACSVASADLTELPENPDFNRYEEMLRQSLFAPVTVVEVAPPEEKPPWSASLFIVGVVKLGSKQAATVENRDTGERYMLVSGVEGPQGLSLASVQFSQNVGQSEVSIRRGSEFATLKFDQAQTVEPLVSQPTNLEEALRNRAQIGSGMPSPPIPHAMPNPQPQPMPGGASVPQRRRRVISAPQP